MATTIVQKTSAADVAGTPVTQRPATSGWTRIAGKTSTADSAGTPVMQKTKAGWTTVSGH